MDGTGCGAFGKYRSVHDFWRIQKKKSIQKFRSEGYAGCGSEQCTGEQLCCENNFGSAIRYINSDNFKSAKIENNFGSLTVYFDNAAAQGEQRWCMLRVILARCTYIFQKNGGFRIIWSARFW